MPKHVVVICVINVIYIYPPDSCVRQQIHSNSSLQRHNGYDEPYEYLSMFVLRLSVKFDTLRSVGSLIIGVKLKALENVQRISHLGDVC